MQALTRETQVPVIIALNTRDEISDLLFGHIDASIRENALCQKSSLIQYPGASNTVMA